MTHPQWDPIALQFGPLAIHWYGLMYLLGFGAVWALALWRAKRSQGLWSVDQVNDLIFYGAMGVILGGRVGYILFYQFSEFIYDPLLLLRVWQGGMSFHGGLLGVLLALALYSYRHGKAYLQVTDFIAPLVPLGLAAGRFGNFINGELWGKPSSMPWAVVFPQVDGIPRHPSQLYEMLFEGLLLFAILWIYSAKPRPTKTVSALFLLLYGSFRMIIEFFREPDSHIGYLAFDWLTMGQVLSLPMIVLGVILWRSRGK